MVVPEYEIDTYYTPTFVGKYLLEELETKYCVDITAEVEIEIENENEE